MVDAAQGSGEVRDAFQALGVSVTDSQGRMRSSKEVMLDIAERFSKIQDGAVKTAAAMKLFGKSGAELIPTLNAGKEGLEKLGAEVDALGIRMTEDLAKAAEEVNDNLTRMAKGAQGAGIQLMHALMPALQEVAKWGVEAAEGLAALISQTEKGQIKRRILEINDEIRALQGELVDVGPDQAASPGLFSRIWDSVFGDGTPGKEKAQNRIKELEAELKELGIKLYEVSQPRPPQKTGGEAPWLSEAEQEKQLREYLAMVDKRWQVEQKRSEQIGELYLVNQKIRDDEIEKDKKRQEEFLHNREAVMSQLFGAHDAYLEVRRGQIDEEVQAYEESQKQMQKLTEHFAEKMMDTMSDLFFSAMTGEFKSLEEVAESTLRAIQRMVADYIAKIASEFLVNQSSSILKSIFSSFSLVGAGGGAAGAGAGAYTAAEMNSMMWLHEGGEVGPGAPRRYMPAYLMAGAPRLHSGLAADEFPAILQKGERVISKSKASEGMGTPTFNVVINAVDPVSFAELAARNPQAIISPFLTALNQGGQVRNAIRNVM
jgi:uncharacterized phage infection (PIP) family protein YhgE